MSATHPEKVLNQSLEELEGDYWDDPGEATSLVRRCHNLRKVPIGQLRASDLRLLIGQQIGLLRLVPLALDHLQRDLLMEADYYPGDMLGALLRLPPAFWERQSQMRAQLVELLRRSGSHDLIRFTDSADPELGTLAEEFLMRSV